MQAAWMVVHSLMTSLPWVDWLIDELDGSPTAQALFFVLVVLGRFALDHWERRREIQQHRRRRHGGNA